MSMGKQLLAWAGTICATAIPLVFIWTTGLADEPAGTAAAIPPAVRTIVVAAPSETLSRQFYGRVVAKETVDLGFIVGGRLERLAPEEGTRIAAGQTIAVLDQDPFFRAVERAELSLDIARREAERALTLSERSVAPESRAEDATTVRDLAEVALRDARAALADATLTAPFDALVAARLAPEHSIVAPGQPILRLHDMSEVRVEIDLPERVFVASGGLDGVRFMARVGDGADVTLRLVAFQPDAARVGQSYRVTLAFPNDPGAALLPGASVTVIASVPMQGGGIAVPAGALLAQNDRSASVFVLDGPGDPATIRRMPVGLVTQSGTTFLVEGLTAGAEVVAAGAHRLTDGQTVRRAPDLRFVEN